MNQPWGWYSRAFLCVSRRAWVTTCADPVFPATWMPSSLARSPVPSLTTPNIAVAHGRDDLRAEAEVSGGG